MPIARPEYSELLTGEIANSEIPRLRGTTFVYSVPFIRILAGCYRSWVGEFDSWKPLADFINESSTTYGGDTRLLPWKVTDSSSMAAFGRRQLTVLATNWIVHQAKAASEDPSND